MKKIVRTLIVIMLLSVLFSCVAYADDSSARLNYVTDDAGLLTFSQYQELEQTAAEISGKYGCSVYIITVADFKAFNYSDVYSCATAMFDYYELGYGSDKSGVMLLLSMAERDYALIAHGTVGNRAFTDYGKDLLSEKFLDNFRSNDWYGGFADYLDWCNYMLGEDAGGTPVDISQKPGTGSTGLNLLIIIGLPCLVALIVCSGFKAQMKTARSKTEAGDYVAGGLQLRVREDRFVHRTQTRQIIQQPTNRSGGSGFSGGGTTIGSGGFSGKSGKF